MRQLRRQPPPATLEAVQVAAPVGGLNTLASASALPEGDALQAFNVVASDKGLRTRLGYRRHNTSLSPARTLMPYMGSASDGSRDRLFAADDLGIVDVTNLNAAGTVPTILWGIGTGTGQSGLSGYGTCHAFTTSGGHFLLYCDEVNGYYVYSEATDLWTKPTQGGGATQIAGVDPANLCFVMVWKSRVWFVEKNSPNVYYLSAGAIYGTATLLNLDRSAQFRQGGGVRCLANWTQDGGFGIDDYLAAVGDGGDVAIYQGTDPASATTFTLKGTWNAGGLVAGRRVASTFGGDVLILTKAGVRPLSQLVVGKDGQETFLTAKIANLFNRLTLDKGELTGWAMYIHPEENALIINVPNPSDSSGTSSTQQLVQSLWNRSWTRFRDLPLSAACVWRGKLYFGGPDVSYASTGISRIWVNDGGVDDISLADPTVFTAIQWQLLTPFRPSGGQHLQVELIRPAFLSNEQSPAWRAEARYNLDLREVSTVAVGAASGSSSFGSATWDSGTWAEDETPSRATVGATGLGTDMAISLRGASISRTVLVGIDVFFKRGGYL